MTATSLQERVMIQELASSGCTDGQIANGLGLSKEMVRKWRRKGQRQGYRGLSSRMGRPVRGSLSTFPVKFANTLQDWRRGHPGWGPKTLHTEMLLDPLFEGAHLPSEATITRWLREKKLVRPYQKHSELPPQCLSPAQGCHEEWEMDARGHEKIPDAGVISLIDINDVFSKVKIISYPCWLGEQRATRHATTEDYQVVLRLAFTEWGLVDRLAVDHDSIFFDNHSKSPFPVRLQLWLMALGVALTFGRMGQPKDQAMTERSHQTWDQQVLEGQHFVGQEVLRQALNKRRSFLNYSLPCETLGNVPPLVAHPEALRPRRTYRPEWEIDMLRLDRVYAYLSQGRWFRKASNIGAVTLGQVIYCLGRPWQKQEVEITFDTEDHDLVFQAPEMTKRLPIRGISAEELMGQMGSLAHLKDFQLSLPFTWDDWRQIQVCQLLSPVRLSDALSGTT